MRTFVTLSLTLLLVFAACKRSETKTAQTDDTQTTTQETMTQNQSPAAGTGKLEKWPADYPVDGDSVAIISVAINGQPAGDMVAEFYPDKAPNHVRNFKWLANHKYYDGVKFHRVIKGFMIQGGDPTGTGGGGPGWALNAEFNDIKHEKGILSMARTSDPNSAGSQFFVMHGTSPHLDNQYTVFGRVVKGVELVDQIVEIPTTGPERSTPTQEIKMTSVRIVPRAEAKL